MNNLQVEVNEVWDFSLYLQFMGFIDPSSDYAYYNNQHLELYDFLQKESEEKVIEKLPELKRSLIQMITPFVQKYPPKVEIGMIAKAWNDQFKDQKDVLGKGVLFGWLAKLMNVANLNTYTDDYLPYQTSVGVAVHKGFMSVEEEFLLTDSYNLLLKAEYAQHVLNTYGNIKKAEAIRSDKKTFENPIYATISHLKFDVAAYARLCVLSFYSFMECFVNSMGYSFLKYQEDSLTEDKKETLLGLKKGRYLHLKYKLEAFQRIMRPDSTPAFITTDEKQMPSVIRSFFAEYEGLRNSAMHYSPLKESIWLKATEWVAKAQSFAKVTMECAFLFWAACRETDTGPYYLGKLDHNRLYKDAQARMLSIKMAQLEIVTDKELS